jgi:hypothetical protein
MAWSSWEEALGRCKVPAGAALAKQPLDPDLPVHVCAGHQGRRTDPAAVLDFIGPF